VGKGVDVSMALTLCDGRAIKVIDRTIPEIYSSCRKMSRLDIIDLCWMLKDIGVDLVEINTDMLKKAGKLPSGIDFLLRITSVGDIQILNSYNIKNCIMNEEFLIELGNPADIISKDINLAAEFKVDSMAKLHQMRKSKCLRETNKINTIRVTGLSDCLSLEWIGIAKEVAKALNVNMDICPENRYYIATAVAVEAVMNGMDFITASFLGYGECSRYAALEEVLLSAKVLINSRSNTDLGILPEFCRHFEKITGKCIADNKPVAGKGIFSVESGIHADGIAKDPSIYEPFEPCIVGQERNLSIGKHSGTRSVIKKLAELNIHYKHDKIDDIVRKIRDKSTKLKRALRDEEIKEICG